MLPPVAQTEETKMQSPVAQIEETRMLSAVAQDAGAREEDAGVARPADAGGNRRRRRMPESLG